LHHSMDRSLGTLCGGGNDWVVYIDSHLLGLGRGARGEGPGALQHAHVQIIPRAIDIDERPVRRGRGDLFHQSGGLRGERIPVMSSSCLRVTYLIAQGRHFRHAEA
jgi:hypothetical protein